MRNLPATSFQITSLKEDNFSFSPKDQSYNSKGSRQLQREKPYENQFAFPKTANRIPLFHFWSCFGKTT